MNNPTKNYWLCAYMKDGSPIMHHCVAATLDAVTEYAHCVLEDKDVDYCVPVLVIQSPLDIEIRRAK